MLTRKLYTFSFFSIFKEKGGNPKNVGKVASLDLFVNDYVAESVSEVEPPSLLQLSVFPQRPYIIKTVHSYTSPM